MFHIDYKKEAAEWHKDLLHDTCIERINEYSNLVGLAFAKTSSHDDRIKFMEISDIKDEKKLLEKPLIKNLKHYSNIDDVSLSDIEERIGDMLSFINSELDNILIGTPEQLLSIYKRIRDNYNYMISDADGKDRIELYNERSITQEGFVFNILEKVFDYNDYSSNHAYELTKRLNVSICPYCNREYIDTIIDENNKKVARPDLDHYFGQKKLPLFRLSFQNLIPSGAICNRSIKGQRELDINKHMHPYIKDDMIHFKLKMGPDLEIKCNIEAEEGTKAFNTIDFFKLKPIYSCHSNVAVKAFDIMKEYTPEYIADLVRILNGRLGQGRRTSKKKLFEIFFSEFKTDDPENEMLGNMKSDIYNSIKNIYFPMYIRIMKCYTERAVDKHPKIW